MGSSQEMGHPISSPKKMDKFYRDPGKGVGRLRVQPCPGDVTRRTALGYRNPAGGWVTSGSTFCTEEDKNANAGARRQKTWAPRRRTEPRSWSVGVSVHYLHLS